MKILSFREGGKMFDSIGTLAKPAQQECLDLCFSSPMALYWRCMCVNDACRHVAARKGSPRLLRLLLSYTGPGYVRLQDCGGETALDVAWSHKHNAAITELTRVARG